MGVRLPTISPWLFQLLLAAALTRLAGTPELIEACIACGASTVEPFLDLGQMALANKFLHHADLARAEPHFALDVGFCLACSHVQLNRHVPPREMFEDYLYVSSASDTLKAHLLDLSDVVAERCSLGEGDLVVDVGANDGTLLKAFRRHGVTALGVDPARNLAELYDDPQIVRYTRFFDSSSALEIRKEHGQAAVVTATNTLPHIAAPRDFARAVDCLLAPGGSLVIEAHYLSDLLEQCAFDTIYHEHVSYWALGPMARMFEEHGMRVVDVERLPVHHGQLRIFVQRAGEGEVAPSVESLLAAELSAGLDRIETLRDFAERTLRLKEDLRRTLARLRAEGKRVVGYGASAKGNTLLGFLELGPEDIDYIADCSPLKQGLYTPGTHIPVVAPERLLEDQPDYVVLLAWNLADEVLEQQSEYRRRGGKFILPVPEVRTLS